MKGSKIKVGIGFATGRKHFQRILRSYVYNWQESNLLNNENVELNLFVAYDLAYRNTKRADYTSINPEIAEFITGKYFIGSNEVEKTKQNLIQNGHLEPQEASLLFGKGYASQRNIILYYAIKNHMDYLLFLDDDEYPMAVTKNADIAIWGGQHVLKTHLYSIKNADITYGYHCGYISPIPFIEFSDTLTENDFQLFIQAISNDIVNWDNIKKVMQYGGVSYADTKIIQNHEIIEIPEIQHAKFISGSNLCINLTRTNRVFPFYNPPGARGEDTFLSTCLGQRRVLRVPCYAFHDGFSSYNHLLSGVLPTSLKFIRPDSEKVVRRFYNACIGWVRYKPLFLYITDQDHYEDMIKEMTEKLHKTLPLICRYFGTEAFLNIMVELKRYHRNVEKHYRSFMETKRIWAKLMENIPEEESDRKIKSHIMQQIYAFE